MKHKHADLIHAWADGARIQLKLNTTNGSWVDDPTPYWTETTEYRIKPGEKKPVVRWLWAYDDGGPVSGFLTEYEAKRAGYTVKLDWSRTEFTE